MTEVAFLAIAAVIFGAVGKLWSDMKELTKKHDSVQAEHTDCQVKMATMNGEIKILKLQMKHLEDANLGQVIGAEDIAVGADQAGLITFWSFAAAKFFGYSIPEAVGHSVEEMLVPPSLRSKHGDKFKALLGSAKIEMKHTIPNVPVLTKETRELPDVKLKVCDLYVVGDKSSGEWKFVTKFRPH